MLQILNSNIKNCLPYIYYQNFNKENSIIIHYKNLRFCINLLKKHIGLQFKMLTCISGVDLLVGNYRFVVVYELLSLTFNSRLRIKIFLNENSWPYTVTPIFINANWWEREVWDLFGIFLKNILIYVES